MKDQKMVLGPAQIPINFECDLDDHQYTKNTRDFHIYLLSALVEVFVLRMPQLNDFKDIISFLSDL